MVIYVARNGKKSKVLTEEQFLDLVSKNEILPTDMVWFQGSKDWVPSSVLIKQLTEKETPLQPPPLPKDNVTESNEFSSKSSDDATEHNDSSVRSIWQGIKDWLSIQLNNFRRNVHYSRNVKVILGVLVLVFAALIILNLPKKESYYSQGQRLLRSNKFTESIEAFNKIPENDQYYSKRQELIDSVQAKADREYRNLIVIRLSDLDTGSAYTALAMLRSVNPNTSLTRSHIDTFFTAYLTRYDSLLRVAEQEEDHAQIVLISKKMLNIPEYKAEAKARIKKYTALIEEKENAKYKALIEQAIEDKQYQKALELIPKLSGKEFEYASKTKELIEKKILKDKVDNYKKNAVNISYGEMLRNPGKHTNSIVALQGRVAEVYRGLFRMNAHFCHTYGRFGRVECSDETIVFKFSGDLNLIEDDYIEIVGTFSKLYSYENAIRGTITVPFIEVKYVTLLLGRR